MLITFTMAEVLVGAIGIAGAALFIGSFAREGRSLFGMKKAQPKITGPPPPPKYRQRDYRREYDRYYGRKGADWNELTAKQKKHRLHNASRHEAREILRKMGINIKGKDVDHIDGDPLNNDPSNLRAVSVNANRSKNKKT